MTRPSGRIRGPSSSAMFQPRVSKHACNSYARKTVSFLTSNPSGCCFAPKSGHTTLGPHARAASHTPSPRRGGRAALHEAALRRRSRGERLGWGGERRRRAARLFTPTLALPHLRGRGACV